MHYAGMAEPEASNLFVYRHQQTKKLLMLYPKNQNSGLISKQKEDETYTIKPSSTQVTSIVYRLVQSNGHHAYHRNQKRTV